MNDPNQKILCKQKYGSKCAGKLKAVKFLVEQLNNKLSCTALCSGCYKELKPYVNPIYGFFLSKEQYLNAQEIGLKACVHCRKYCGQKCKECRIYLQSKHLI